MFWPTMEQTHEQWQAIRDFKASLTIRDSKGGEDTYPIPFKVAYDGRSVFPGYGGVTFTVDSPCAVVIDLASPERVPKDVGVFL